MATNATLRAARVAVREGKPVPAIVAAQLEAIGIDVGELERRIRQNMEFER